MANAYSLDFSPIAQVGQEAVQAGNQFQQAAVTQENLKKIKMENAEAQRKEDYMNKTIDLTQFLKSSGIPDESIEHATKTAETLGMGQKTDSGYNITMREGQALMQHYETNIDKYKAFTAPMIQEAGVKANTAFRGYNETKEKADTDALKAKALGIKPNEKLQEQLKIAEASYKKEYNNYQELNNKTQQGSDKVAINQEHYQLEQSGEWDKLPANIKIAAMNAAETGDYKTWGAVLTKYKEANLYANQTEEQLTARALKGDPEAQSVLDSMKARKISIEQEGAKAKQDEKDKAIDITSLASAVSNGQDAPTAIKGSMGNPVSSKVKTEVLKQYPKFNFTLADANYKWKSSPTNMRTVNFAQGSLQRVQALKMQIADLKNTSIPAINEAMRQVSINLGKPEYTNFESNRNAIVQEVNTALSGSSTGSDLRVNIELENLKSARSPQQLIGAVNNLYEALSTRLDVDLSPIYPIEVVRGEKSLGQYKKELYEKYGGDYTQHHHMDEMTPKENAPGSNQPPFDVTVQKAPKPGTKLTDMKIVSAYMKAANGDKNVARKLAKTDGWSL